MSRHEVDPWTKFGYLLSATGLAVGIYSLVRDPPPVPLALPSEAERLLHPGEHVLLLGDSIAEGIQHPLNALSDSYGTVLTSQIKRGTTIRYWASRVEDHDGAYKVIVLSLGSNDAVAQPETERNDLALLLSHLRSHGATVVWLRPPSFVKGALKPGQQAVETLFYDASVPALELKGPAVDVSQDPMKLHPSPAGYKTLAAQVFDALTT